MDKKRRTLLITVAAVLLVVAIFLLPRRSQPLGELIPAPETARVDGLFYISTIVPTPDGYGTFDTGDCRVEGYPDSEAAAALRSAMSEISVQRYYRHLAFLPLHAELELRHHLVDPRRRTEARPIPQLGRGLHLRRRQPRRRLQDRRRRAAGVQRALRRHQ